MLSMKMSRNEMMTKSDGSDGFILLMETQSVRSEFQDLQQKMVINNYEYEGIPRPKEGKSSNI